MKKIMNKIMRRCFKSMAKCLTKYKLCTVVNNDVIELNKLIGFYEYLIRQNIDYFRCNESLKNDVMILANVQFSYAYEDETGFVVIVDDDMYSFKYTVYKDSSSRLKYAMITDDNTDEFGFVLQ
jgi:hypothetical protein